MKKVVKVILAGLAGLLLASCSEVVDNTTISFVVPGAARAATGESCKVKIELTSDDGLKNYEATGTSGDTIELQVEAGKVYNVHGAMYKCVKNTDPISSGNMQYLEKYYSGRSSVLARKGYSNTVELNMKSTEVLDLTKLSDRMQRNNYQDLDAGTYKVTYNASNSLYNVDIKDEVFIRGSGEIDIKISSSGNNVLYIVDNVYPGPSYSLDISNVTLDGSLLGDSAVAMFNLTTQGSFTLSDVRIKNLDNNKKVVNETDNYCTPTLKNVSIDRKLPYGSNDVYAAGGVSLDGYFYGNLYIGSGSTIRLKSNFNSQSKINVVTDYYDVAESFQLINFSSLGLEALPDAYINCFNITVPEWVDQLTGKLLKPTLLATGWLQK